MHPAEAVFVWSVVLSPIWGGALMYLLHRAGSRKEKELRTAALQGALSAAWEQGRRDAAAAHLAAREREAVQAYLAAQKKS